MTEFGPHPTVLLVEDTPDLARVLARELEASGYRVLRAADGRTALDLHARDRPDLVVLDWMLPGLDGLEVLRRLRQAPVAYGQLALDPERHAAILDGRPLDLTPHEFALLHLLLRRPRRAFSRSYLLETVWGQEYVGSDRSVDNAVLRLRKKLGPLGDAIETVWGVGYRLRPAPPPADPATGAGP